MGTWGGGSGGRLQLVSLIFEKLQIPPPNFRPSAEGYARFRTSHVKSSSL